MKKRFLAVIAAVLICGLCGCGKNETGSVSDSAANSTENSLDSTEFDFNDALRNFTLFGKKIPFPCTITEFGENFSLDDPSKMILMESTHQVSSSLFYKGKSIGTVVLADCGENDTFQEKQISYMSLGFITDKGRMTEEQRKLAFDAYGWYTDPIRFEFAGISFDTSAEDIIAKLGAPKEDTEKADYDNTIIREINYEYSDGGYLYFSFANGKMFYVNIAFGQKNRRN